MELQSNQRKLVIIEPFCEVSGSHKQFLDTLCMLLHNNIDINLFTQKGVKFHWRMRCSALYFAQTIPKFEQERNEQGILLCTSVLNLTEFLGLRPDFLTWKKLIYFHENQLIYPVQNNAENDFAFGFAQIMSCLSADHIFFNSAFNMNSFINEINHFFKRMPDYRPDKNTPEQIRSKSSVLYFPLDLPPQISSSCQQHTDSQTHHSKKLRILYNGRWEHDKNPQLFFSVIRKVCLTIGDIQSGEQLEDWGEENEGKSDMEKDIDINDQEIGDNSKNIKDKINHSNSFELCILGQAYGETPPVFTKAHRLFQRHIIQWGRLESRSDYFRMMSTCDVVVSTADHEFFGVAIIEAMSQGCFPIVPNRLAYPEVLNIEGLQSDEKILDSEKQPSKGKDNKKNFCGFLYNTENQLYHKILQCVRDPIHAISNEDRILAIQQSNRFSTEQLKGQYLHDILEIDSRTSKDNK